MDDTAAAELLQDRAIAQAAAYCAESCADAAHDPSTAGELPKDRDWSTGRIRRGASAANAADDAHTRGVTRATDTTHVRGESRDATRNARSAHLKVAMKAVTTWGGGEASKRGFFMYKLVFFRASAPPPTGHRVRGEAQTLSPPSPLLTPLLQTLCLSRLRHQSVRFRFELNKLKQS